MENKSHEVIVRAPTPEEEFNHLGFVLKSKDLYYKNGYKVSYPDAVELRDPGILSDLNSHFPLFIDKEYRVDYYSEGISTIKKNLISIQSNVNKLSLIKEFWNFKMFPSYTVVLTKYGPGGSYDPVNGKVTMLTTKDGRFKRSHPEHTIVHEIAHMGIENSIVKKYGLNHAEKERLVDLLVQKYFVTELPEYDLQSIGDSQLDTYIQDIKSIPAEVQQYVNNRSSKAI